MRKSHFSTIFLLAIAFLLPTVLNAQPKYKFGHIDSQVLFDQMPEKDKAQKELEKEAKSLEDQLELMQVEANKKYNELIENEKLDKSSDKKWTSAIREYKEKEIKDLQNRIQEFQMSAQQTLQKKRNELLQPITEKINKAIKKVAEQNGFTYIFEVNMLLYFSKDSEDITPLVKKELGLQ